MDQDFPIGFRFRPTEEEIITLLWLKATNQQQHIPDVVPEKKLYGADASPWKLLGDDDVHWESTDDSGKKHTKRMAYVFTKQSKMSANRIARTAGCGTWEGQAKGQDVANSGGEIIGSRKMLSYVLNSGLPQEGGWIMHEYSLADSLLNRIGSTDYVVCGITIDDEKYTKVKSMAEAKQRVNQSGSMRSCTKNPKVLGKRSEPSFVQESSKPSKTLRREVVEEETSVNAAANLAMGTSSDAAIETPNSLNKCEGFVISLQAIMSPELFGMNGQTSCTDVSLEGTQPVNLMGGIGDGFLLDDDMVQCTGLLDGILQEDDGSLQSELTLQYSQQSFDQYQEVGQGSDFPNPEMVLVELVQTQLRDSTDLSVQVMECEGSGEDSVIKRKENLQPEGNLDPVAINVDQATEAENLKKQFEVPSQQTSLRSVDFGAAPITSQAMMDDLFSDEFLPFSGDDEDIYALKSWDPVVGSGPGR